MSMHPVTAQVLAVLFTLTILASGPARAEPFVVVQNGQAACAVALDLRGSTLSHGDLEAETKGISGGGTDAYSLVTWGRFLAERINAATGADLNVQLDAADTGRMIVISLAENYPDIARAAGLDFDARQADPIAFYDGFCITASGDRLYILGHTELGCRHGVATLLEHLGFRFYNPSPRWWIAPRTQDLVADLSVARAPTFFNVEIATNAGHHMNHGNGTETYLWDIQEIWYAMNRTAGLRFNPGPRFSAGPFAFDFTRSVKAELEAHPEYFAMLADGRRDVDKPLASRMPCISNPRMIELIVRDRLKLLDTRRSKDRFHPMISGEYSSGNFGTCQCPDCLQLGSSDDRMFTLVNEIARAVRAKYPDAYVAVRVFGAGIPSIDIEENVCISISQPALVPAWAGKVRFVGTRHLLPGYLPRKNDQTQQAAYYQRLVQSSREHNVRSLQSELAPAWGGPQTPLLYVVTQLFWDPAADPDRLFREFFDLSFGEAAGPVRAFWDKLQVGSYRDDGTVAAMLADLAAAYGAEDRDDVRKRVIDLMFYVHGLILYREFEQVNDREGRNRTDAFYDALLPVMTYLARHSYRSMMCPSVLAMQHCNRTALEDGREDFYWYRYEKLKPPLDPVWMDPELPWRARPVVVRRGDPRVEAAFHDDEILLQFRKDLERFSTAAGD